MRNDKVFLLQLVEENVYKRGLSVRVPSLKDLEMGTVYLVCTSSWYPNSGCWLQMYVLME